MLRWQDALEGCYGRLIGLKTFSGDLAGLFLGVLSSLPFMKRRLDGSLVGSPNPRSFSQHHQAFPRVNDLIACRTIFTE
jgi:hypothetical protein